jgi:hypothetical protein
MDLARKRERRRYRDEADVEINGFHSKKPRLNYEEIASLQLI